MTLLTVCFGSVASLFFFSGLFRPWFSFSLYSRRSGRMFHLTLMCFTGQQDLREAHPLEGFPCSLPECSGKSVQKGGTVHVETVETIERRRFLRGP